MTERKKPVRKAAPKKLEKAVELPPEAELVKQISQKRQQAKNLNAEASILQEELISLLSSTNDEFESDEYRAVVVRGESTSYDEAMIREAVSDKVWLRVSERHLDTGKLEHEVNVGTINLDDIINAVSVKPRNPFVKITLKASVAEPQQES